MKNRDILSEFNNVIFENEHINFGLTVNSVGLKSILPAENVDKEDKVTRLKYQFKKGRIADEFKLIYITQGSGYVRFEDRDDIQISKGKILMIFPNQKYQYYHLEETEWKEYFIRFEAGAVYTQLIRSYFFDDNQVVDVGFKDEMLVLFQRMIEVVKNGLKSSQIYLSGMLLHIMGFIISETKNHALQKREIKITEQAKVIMNENLYQEISIQEIASRLNTGYTTFRINFKKHTGMAPAKYFHELRLNKAKQMLTETTLSVKEIAYMLQFSSTNQFSTFFRKSLGVSPKSLREKK
jgi:AraC-like DNA-binding protein